MNVRKCLAATAVGLVVLAAADPAAAASTAPTTPLPQIPSLCALAGGTAPEPVRMSAPNSFDFGAGTLVDGVPSGCGRLTWDLSDPATITPRLTGTLFARNAVGSTVRMVLRHRDVRGIELGVTRGAAKFVDSNDDTTFSIDLGNYASPSIYEVDVELQQLSGATDSWNTIASSSHHLGSSTKAPDGILLDGGDQSFGLRPFEDGAPSGPGTLTWELTANGIVPHLTGDLFLRNSAFTPTRLRITYLDVRGDAMSAPATLSYETSQNGLVRLPVDWSGPANRYLYSVEVRLEVGPYSTPIIVAGPATATI